MTLGQRIRQARGTRTQVSVATAAGLHKAYLCDIEKGLRFPPPATIKRLAAVLELDATPWLWLWVVEQLGTEDTQAVAHWAAREEMQ